MLEHLTLENCTFSYGKNSAPVLKDISFALSKNDFTCLVGPNGSGKSTLLKALLKSIPSTMFPSTSSGNGITSPHKFPEPVEWNEGITSPPEHVEGREGIAKKLSPKEKAKIVAYLPQNEAPLWNYTVFETVLQGRFCHTNALGIYSKSDREIAKQTLAEFGLADLRDKAINEISGGEFQKVRLARCFAQQSDFLILDEPTTSLDFVVSAKLMEELKQKAESRGIGVLISIHDVNLALRFAKSLALLGKYNAEKQKQFFVELPLPSTGSGSGGISESSGSGILANPKPKTAELEAALSAAYGESVSLKERLCAGCL